MTPETDPRYLVTDLASSDLTRDVAGWLGLTLTENSNGESLYSEGLMHRVQDYITAIMLGGIDDATVRQRKIVRSYLADQLRFGNPESYLHDLLTYADLVKFSGASVDQLTPDGVVNLHHYRVLGWVDPMPDLVMSERSIVAMKTFRQLVDVYLNFIPRWDGTHQSISGIVPIEMVQFETMEKASWVINDENMVRYIWNNHEKAADIAALVSARQITNWESLRLIVEHETPAIREGVL